MEIELVRVLFVSLLFLIAGSMIIKFARDSLLKLKKKMTVGSIGAALVVAGLREVNYAYTVFSLEFMDIAVMISLLVTITLMWIHRFELVGATYRYAYLKKSAALNTRVEQTKSNG